MCWSFFPENISFLFPLDARRAFFFSFAPDFSSFFSEPSFFGNTDRASFLFVDAGFPLRVSFFLIGKLSARRSGRFLLPGSGPTPLFFPPAP